VTYVEVEDNNIIQIKTKDKDWYNAVVVWTHKYVNPSKNQIYKNIREFKTDSLDWFNKWDKIWLSIFSWVENLTISWTSKWKWTAWPVKRWHKKILHKTHWAKYQRHWSTMNCSTHRSRKGIKMAWRMWDISVTLRDRKVAHIDLENRVIAIKWALPWSINSLIILKNDQNK
jgi:ribosomal protein L3